LESLSRLPVKDNMAGWTEEAVDRVSRYSIDLADELQSIPLPSGFRSEGWRPPVNEPQD
jgi:hypothetical protein